MQTRMFGLFIRVGYLTQRGDIIMHVQLLIAFMCYSCKLVLSAEQAAQSMFRPTTPETLTSENYPNEIHWITTEDGYILQIHRITGPGPRNSTVSRRGLPILVTHSLCSSSYDYIALGPDLALGYLLADNGFDVWLINNRGNEYSTNHTTLDPHSWIDHRYWDFTWHEMGIYDLPAVIDYVLNTTGFQQVYQIGMSEGATQFYVMTSSRPAYNDKVKAHFSYAPATFLCHLSNVPTLILTFPERYGLVSFVTQFIGSFSVIPNSELFSYLTAVCPLNALTESFCGSIYSPFADSNPEQQSPEKQRLILQHTPSGCSSKTIIHYTQSVRSCGFGLYQDNFFQPRQEYDLQNIRTPLYVYYSNIDRFVSSLDVFHLNDTLTVGFAASSENRVLGHADFVYGISARALVYDDTISRLINFNDD